MGKPHAPRRSKAAIRLFLKLTGGGGRQSRSLTRFAVEPLEKRTMLNGIPLYWNPLGDSAASGGAFLALRVCMKLGSNVFVAASLALSLLTLFHWWRSYRIYDDFEWFYYQGAVKSVRSANRVFILQGCFVRL